MAQNSLYFVLLEIQSYYSEVDTFLSEFTNIIKNVFFVSIYYILN
jgi:hypothetical protein